MVLVMFKTFDNKFIELFLKYSVSGAGKPEKETMDLNLDPVNFIVDSQNSSTPFLTLTNTGGLLVF